MRQYKTKIDGRIKELVTHLGIVVKVGNTPREEGVELDDFPEPAAYVGQGVIFVHTKTKFSPAWMNIILLHEIGHAITDFYFYRHKISEKMDEISANAISLALAASLDIRVPPGVVKNYAKYTRTRSLDMTITR